MTYKTRQEVLRAAADWMDVCEKAGVRFSYKLSGMILHNPSFSDAPECYEFPLALLEGKEVWVGSELYWDDGSRVTVTEAWNINANWKLLSWNQPESKTVIVEMTVDDAERALYCLSKSDVPVAIKRAIGAFKKALENIK